MAPAPTRALGWAKAALVALAIVALWAVAGAGFVGSSSASTSPNRSRLPVNVHSQRGGRPPLLLGLSKDAGSVGLGSVEYPSKAVLHFAKIDPATAVPPEPQLALLVVPGGAYGRVALQREGTLAAEQLAQRLRPSLVCMLEYTTPPLHSETPVEELMRAVDWVRSSAPARLVVAGFSAGGHLVAMAAATGKLSCDDMVLCYPVVTMKDPLAHNTSRRNLLAGEPLTREWIAQHSVEEHPWLEPRRVFIWHTQFDEKVPVAHSELLFEQLNRHRSVAAVQPKFEVDSSTNWTRRVRIADSGRLTFVKYRRGAHASWGRGEGDASRGVWTQDVALWILSGQLPM